MRDFLQSEKVVDAQNLMFCISLCHTAITSKNGEIICDSADELTMLNNVKQIGYKFIRRQEDILTMRVFNIDMKFKLVTLFPFDPIRKMMSVVLLTEQGDYVMFSKGADTAILSRLGNSEAKIKKIQNKCDKFGKAGYRTMVMAMRKFDEVTIKEFE